jgi:SAM-dependent methyltransferase
MDIDDRVRDALPVNLPYDGLVAEAYDCWLPHDGDYDDVDRWRGAIESGGGPALELGCGTGRLLLRFVAAGLDVEGVDSAADMLAICRAHADAAGHSVTLHHDDWATMALPRRYMTLYNPSGSFMLLDDEDRARQALATWMRHLAPGGRLMIEMGIPRADFDAHWEWHVRRSATRGSDGLTFMVHEATRCDVNAQLQHSLHRHEVWDASGELVTTYLRRHRLRWWTGEQLERALLDCGATQVRRFGSEDEFLVVGRAP